MRKKTGKRRREKCTAELESQEEKEGKDEKERKRKTGRKM